MNFPQLHAADVCINFSCPLILWCCRLVAGSPDLRSCLLYQKMQVSWRTQTCYGIDPHIMLWTIYYISWLSSLLCGVINRPYHNNYSRFSFMRCIANWCLLHFCLSTHSIINFSNDQYSRDHDLTIDKNAIKIKKFPGFFAFYCKLKSRIFLWIVSLAHKHVKRCTGEALQPVNVNFLITGCNHF